MALVTIKEASKWATDYLAKSVSPTNIAYLVQHGRVKKYQENGLTLIDLNNLKEYYASWQDGRETAWKKTLGQDLNWSLAFDHLREKDTTKHVHRLHPYKGKFIPQLAQYFIDAHTDQYKKEIYFRPGDILLDPFAGSGTTLVQANELNMRSIGIDISQFNCAIARSKLHQYDYDALHQTTFHIQKTLASYACDSSTYAFEAELTKRLGTFNALHFPNPAFRQGQVDEATYGAAKEDEFRWIYADLLQKYAITLKQNNAANFLDAWYCASMRREIDLVFQLLQQIKDSGNKQLLTILLSRTIRSCRATKHGDLATLKNPQFTTYYCWKHKKICKPLYSIKSWFNRYAKDTLARLKAFDRVRTKAHSTTLAADSRTVDILAAVAKQNKDFYQLLRAQKIRGIFTSPPYVGQIDYHEQHAYAYDLFGFDRKDDLEIGPLYRGQGRAARASYVDGVAKVLINCRNYLADDFNAFLVANDKYNLYPTIAAKADMQIVNTFKRPVLNRAERDKAPYAEMIFHLKGKERHRQFSADLMN